MKRFLATLTVSALVLASPGLGAYRAAAAGFAVTASRSATIGATGAQAGAVATVPGSAVTGGLSLPLNSTGLGSSLPTLSAPRVSVAGLGAALRPPARQGPGLPVTGGPGAVAPQEGRWATVRRVSGVSPHLRSASASHAAADASVRSGLVHQTARIRKSAATDRTGVRTSGSISRFFDGIGLHQRAGTSVLGRETAGSRSGLLRSRAAELKGRNAAVPQPDKPKSGLPRSYKVGLVGAAVGLTFTLLIPVVAAALGWEFHSNYAGPALADGATIVDLVRLLLAVVVMAPIAEEVIFRSGILGGLTRIGRKISKNKVASFWVPAVISALIFAAVHETADPVLLTARTLGALVFAWVYHKEGLHASIAMHGFNNALAMSGLVGYALFGPAGAVLTSIGMMVIGGILTILSWRSLERDKADREAGLIVPLPTTAKHALVYAGILAFGLVFISFSPMTSLIWGISMLALLLYAAVKRTG